MLSKKNQKLLKECVEHWFENLMMLQLNYLSNEKFLTENICTNSSGCSFCKTHLDYGDCTGCPIKQKSGMNGCLDTPYVEVYHCNNRVYHNRDQEYTDYFKAIAGEINFLISLGE